MEFKYRKGVALPQGQDFILKPVDIPYLGKGGGVAASIVDANTLVVLVTNLSDIEQKIPRHAKVGTVSETDIQGTYAAHPDDTFLANRPIRKPRKSL